MGKKRMCRCVDVAAGKRRIKSADAKCRCVGKNSEKHVFMFFYLHINVFNICGCNSVCTS